MARTSPSNDSTSGISGLRAWGSIRMKFGIMATMMAPYFKKSWGPRVFHGLGSGFRV